jgi:hypothetical protein
MDIESETLLGSSYQNDEKKRSLLWAVLGGVSFLLLGGAALGSFGDDTSYSMLSRDESDICQNPAYSKTTLKTVYDAPFLALIKDTKGQKKFEASDVIIADKSFYSICDSSWSLERFSEEVNTFSPDNVQIGAPLRPGEHDQESGYEALVHDKQIDLFYLVRESVEHAMTHASAEAAGVDNQNRHVLLKKRTAESHTGETEWHAVVEEVRVDGDDYSVQNKCVSEMQFEGKSKGFEGALGLKDSAGEMYLLGLCEGNHCREGDAGKERGNGKIIVMRKEATKAAAPFLGYYCVWKTVREIAIPKAVHFKDYSAISINAKGRIAITSQEDSRVWLGALTHYSNGIFDPEKSELDARGSKILDFPRDPNCKVQVSIQVHCQYIYIYIYTTVLSPHHSSRLTKIPILCLFPLSTATLKVFTGIMTRCLLL